MPESSISIAAFIAVSIATVFILLRIKQRLELSLAKYPSLSGHVRWAQRMARWVPGYSYTAEQWFDADGAPKQIADKRREALEQLSNDLRGQSPRTLAQTDASKPMISDLQFISSYRVPFQFSKLLQQHLRIGSYWNSSEGVWLTDMDGNRFIDVTGSYGVNLFGLDFYKSCIEEGAQRVRDLGPALGSYHPCVLDNVKWLRAISGMDEVSFHMSGTEAVMQAVRLARYHTGRNKLVRFTGAYHGWWDDVQPGPGNPLPPASHTITLREMHDATLRVLRNRRDIACVLVNPLQALHPNRPAPTDSMLVDSGRRAAFDRVAYTQWLQALRAVCGERGIVLIIDEVFLGFRLARSGAQEYFGVQADLVTYGKTLGGGLPVGVLCGKSSLMRRFGNERPADICFARGTFNAHPYVMGAMNVFLERLESPPVKALYKGVDALWQDRANRLNKRLEQEELPVRVAAMSTVWTVLFNNPARYNWLFQFYMRRHGIALSWVGSGRLIFSLNFNEQDYEEFCARFVSAARQMAAEGWWWTPQGQTDKAIRRQLLKEMLCERMTAWNQ